MSGGVIQHAKNFKHAISNIGGIEIDWLVLNGTNWWKASLNGHQVILYGNKYLYRVGNLLTFTTNRKLINVMRYLLGLIYRQTNLNQNLNKYDITISLHQNPVLPQPKIYYVHDLQHMYFPEFFSNSDLRIRNNKWKKLSQDAKLNIVETEKVKADLVNFFDVNSDNIKVIETPYYPNDVFEEKSQNFEEKFRCDYVYYPANYWKHKNHNNLLSAFETLQNECPGVELILSGTIGKKELNRLKSRYNCVFQHLGYVSEGEKNQLIKGSSLIVIPSLFESKSQVIDEAIYMGKKICVNKNLYLPQPEYSFYYFFDPLSPESISMSLKTALSSKSVVENSKEMAELYYRKSLDLFCREYRLLIESL
jgi:glycosyltransferase involved in cell wall biosynthesis